MCYVQRPAVCIKERIAFAEEELKREEDDRNVPAMVTGIFRVAS